MKMQKNYDELNDFKVSKNKLTKPNIIVTL